jgi:hypothetical protein
MVFKINSRPFHYHGKHNMIYLNPEIPFLALKNILHPPKKHIARIVVFTMLKTMLLKIN